MVFENSNTWFTFLNSFIYLFLIRKAVVVYGSLLRYVQKKRIFSRESLGTTDVAENKCAAQINV